MGLAITQGGNTEYNRFSVPFKGITSVHVKRFLNINRFNPEVGRKRHADLTTKIRV